VQFTPDSGQLTMTQNKTQVNIQNAPENSYGCV